MKKRLSGLSAFFTSIRWCVSLSWQASKVYTVIRFAVDAMVPLLTIFLAYVGRYLIDLLAGVWIPADIVGTLILLFALLLAGAFVVVSSRKVREYCQSMHEDILNSRISLLLMDSALSADLEHFDETEYYDKLQSAGQNSYAIIHILWNAISCISACISCVAVFVALCQANFIYGLIMITTAIPSATAGARYTKIIYRLSQDQINGQRQMSYYQSVATDKRYAQDIRLFNAGSSLKSRYTYKWTELFLKRKKLAIKRTVTTCILDFLPEIAIILIGAHISSQILLGNGTVGDYSLYTGFTAQLLASITTLTSSTMQIYDNKLRIENIRGLSVFKSHIADSGTTAIDEIDTIAFEDVSFTYPGSQKPALDQVSFSLHSKEKVAVVGMNGSGKSTLIKLLLRMYEPDTGSIFINGKDIHAYSVLALRSHFSVYFQDMPSYCFTLMENLTIADDGVENMVENAEAAFRFSDGHRILSKSPQRLNANLTKFFDPEGIELSGGEYQKLALARTFYRRHTALILDEPSSNLDPEAEEKVFHSIKQLSKGKLTIYTSHRLSNVSLADRVLVLENGKVVEFGTQEELLKRKQRYSELFRYQQEKYQILGEG